MFGRQRFNSNKNDFNWNGWEVTLETFNVPQKLFAVRRAGGHLFVHVVGGHDLHPDLRFRLIEEILKFKQVVKHERIFSELNFDQHFVLGEINLLVCAFNLVVVPRNLDGISIDRLLEPSRTPAGSLALWDLDLEDLDIVLLKI
jgi:hypothetical protein